MVKNLSKVFYLKEILITFSYNKNLKSQLLQNPSFNYFEICTIVKTYSQGQNQLKNLSEHTFRVDTPGGELCEGENRNFRLFNPSV